MQTFMKNYSQPKKLKKGFYELDGFSGVRLASIPNGSGIKIKSMYFVKTKTGMETMPVEMFKVLSNKKPIKI